MRKNLKHFYCVDLEATCWETKEEQGYKPNEIIEIGICKVNLENAVIEDCLSWIVKPRLTEVSRFCTKLTTLTQDEVNQGVDIEDALYYAQDHFKLTKADIWGSWGQYDRNKLSNSGSGSLKSIYGTEMSSIFAQMEHVNLKTIFALQTKSLQGPCGMEKALKILNIPLTGTHHRGVDDAYNIGKIALKMFR